MATNQPPTASQSTTTTTPDFEAIDLPSLGAPVLVYGPFDHDPLTLVDGGNPRVVWPGPTDVAFPDGKGGVVLQPANEPTVVWLPEIEGNAQVRLVMVDGVLLLRGFVADGRVLYSERPDPDAVTESSVEKFFTVALAEGAESELVATSGAYESWTVGPVVAADEESVHASCHLHCSLWSGLPGASVGREPVYHGGGAEAGPTAAIEGLAATPDGRVVAFIEFDITLPEEEQPDLVLVDGASFEVLARVELPLGTGENLGHPTVSLSADGQRVLVTLGGGATGQEQLLVPTNPYLVDGALTDRPQVRRVDAQGAVRWVDPVAGSNSG